MTCAFPPTQRFRPDGGGYSHVSVHRRPLAVFSLLLDEKPAHDPFTGEPIEHGSVESAWEHAWKLAEGGVSIARFRVRKEEL